MITIIGQKITHYVKFLQIRITETSSIASRCMA